MFLPVAEVSILLGEDMNNPKVVTVLSGAAALYFAFSIFGGTEASSSALGTLNWIFFILALIGCVGSLYKIVKGS